MNDKKQQHTPGPWIHEGGGQIIKEGDCSLGEIDVSVFGDSVEENAANVALICAAPDLLSALKDMYNAFAPIFDFNDRQTKALVDAEQAIAKAEVTA